MQVKNGTTPPRITTAERRGVALPPMITISSPRKMMPRPRTTSLNISPSRRSTSLYSRARAGSSSSLRFRKSPKSLSGIGGLGLGSGLAGSPNITTSPNGSPFAKGKNRATATRDRTPSPPKTRSSVSTAKLGFGNFMGSLKNINFGALSGKGRRIAEMRGRRAKSEKQMLISPLKGKVARERGFGERQDELAGTSSVDHLILEEDEDEDLGTTALPTSENHGVDTPRSATSFGSLSMRIPSPFDCQFAFVHSPAGTIDDPFLTPQHSAISLDTDSCMGPPPSPLSSLTNSPRRLRKHLSDNAIQRSKNKAIQLLGAEAKEDVDVHYGKFSGN